MKKTTRKLFSVILALSVMLVSLVPAHAFIDIGEGLWEASWESEYDNGVVLFPGSNNSEMNVSWYSETESVPEVVLADAYSVTDECEVFKGYSVAAPDGD